MFLKRLEITGFKSFAGRTVLDFDSASQVAAVVGPNGSGKSNIADAIRWVLGEQSYKSLRSKKSEDVIFSGSSAKSRASFAKVSLVLDNQDKKAPIDFSEVQISRSVFRDGTSEYLLAGKKARLLDVAELLAKSGFGQSTYTVLGQGMVDSMLFYGPAERKVLFDEAAGVRAYEIKREQTLKKLEDTAANLIRIKDILSELGPRQSALKRQVSRAKEKEETKSNLLEKQKVYFSTIWDRLSQKEKSFKHDLEKIIKEETIITGEIEALNKSFEDVLHAEKERGRGTEEFEQKITDLESKKDSIRQEIFTLRAKIELSGSGLTKKEIETKIAAQKELLSALDIDAKKKDHNKILSKSEALDPEGLRRSIRELESEKDSLRHEIFKLKTDNERAKEGLTKAQINEKSNSLKLELEKLEFDSLRKEKSKLETELSELEIQLEKIDEKVVAKKEELRKVTKEISKLSFGVVGEKLSAILYLQNDFVIQVESTKSLDDLSAVIATGKKISEKLKELRKEIGDAKEGRVSGVAEAQEEIENILSEKERISEGLSTKKSQLMRLEYEVKAAETKKFELEKELGALSSIVPLDENDQKNTEIKIQEKLKEIENIEQKISTKIEERELVSEIKAKVMASEYELRSLEKEKEKIEAEIKRLSDLSPIDSRQKDEHQKKLESKEGDIGKLESEILDLKRQINEKNREFDLQGQKLGEIKDKVTEKQALISNLTQRATEIQVDLGRIEAKKQDTKEEIAREMGSEAALADARVVTELDADLARKEIERLKSKLYSIGEIDPEIESEFTEVTERLEFISTQTEDLEKAKDDLSRLISELDIKIKKQFEGSFNEISKKFSHFFEILFDGGEAKLELVRTKEDILDVEEGKKPEDRFGIEITAVPPGKRVKSLSALSGGERTLASLALLFAILSVNPSPFCVLDEVDAALDETNTKKFLKIVAELSLHTQFIFITHNRETMKSAGLIYGVTMDDSHVSKLLSIKLSDALDTVKK